MQKFFPTWEVAEILKLIEMLSATTDGQKAQTLIGEAIAESRRTGLSPRLAFPRGILDEVEDLTGDVSWLAPISPLWTRTFVEAVAAHYYRAEPDAPAVFYADLRELEYQRFADFEEKSVDRQRDRRNHRSSRHHPGSAGVGFRITDSVKIAAVV